MISMFLLILVFPALAGTAFGGLVVAGLFSAVFVSAALSVFRSRALVVAMACIGTPAIALNWLATLTDLGDVLELAALVWLGAFLLFTVSVMIASILTARRVSAHVLCRAVSAYLLIGIAWASLYQMLIHLDPAALDPPQAKGAWDAATYFSFTVLTTLGFGDITPASPFARSLVMVESVIGPLYLAILVARLVGLHMRSSGPETP